MIQDTAKREPVRLPPKPTIIAKMIFVDCSSGERRPIDVELPVGRAPR